MVHSKYACTTRAKRAGRLTVYRGGRGNVILGLACRASSKVASFLTVMDQNGGVIGCMRRMGATWVLMEDVWMVTWPQGSSWPYLARPDRPGRGLWGRCTPASGLLTPHVGGFWPRPGNAKAEVQRCQGGMPSGLLRRLSLFNKHRPGHLVPREYGIQVEVSRWYLDF
jgi:hypothetical protein